MNQSIKIAVCDYCSAIRYGLRYILNEKTGITVIAEASSPKDILGKFVGLEIDVMLIDIEKNLKNDLSYLQKFRELTPETRIISYTNSSNKNLILETIDLGVHGYLLKHSEPEEIIDAIYIVHKGGSSMAPVVTEALLEQMQRKHQRLHANLSKREQQVLDLIAKGKTNNDIASALFISLRTVKFHVSSILAKLDVKNRTEAALWEE